MQEMLEKKINKPGNWVQTLVKRGITEKQHLKRSCVPLDEILISNHKYELCIRLAISPLTDLKRRCQAPWQGQSMPDSRVPTNKLAHSYGTKIYIR